MKRKKNNQWITQYYILLISESNFIDLNGQFQFRCSLNIHIHCQIDRVLRPRVIIFDGMTIQALQMALKESKSQNMHDSSNQLPSQKFTKSTITMSALDVTIVCWPIIYKNNSVRFSCLH